MTGQAIERHDPGRGFLDFDEAKRRAVVLANSGLVPDNLRKNPDGVMLVGLYGQDLGVPFVAALNEIHVIKGKVSASAQLRLALIRRAGHEARFKSSSATKAVIIGRRSEDRDDPNGWVEVEWTIEQAEKAKLTTKDVWQQYPAEMLRARAASALCRMHFSDVLLGMDPYTPEELGVAEAAEVDPGPDDDEAIEAELPDEPTPAGDDQADDVVDAELVPDAGAPPEEPASDEASKEEPARPLAQQIAMQAEKAGVVRGDVILAVTKGRTSSGREVTPEEGAEVLQAIAALAADELKLDDERHDPDDLENGQPYRMLVAAKKAPPPPPPAGPPATQAKTEEGVPDGEEDSWDADAWRSFIAARGVKVTELLREAVKVAKELELAPPANLDALKGQQSLCALLRGWVEETAEARS